MSTVPRPHSSSPTRRVGRLGTGVSGTVSMCPARTTRSARPSVVRAIDRVAVADHLEVRERPQGRLDGVGEGGLVLADRLDVADRRGERRDVGGQVEDGSTSILCERARWSGRRRGWSTAYAEGYPQRTGGSAAARASVPRVAVSRPLRSPIPLRPCRSATHGVRTGHDHGRTGRCSTRGSRSPAVGERPADARPPRGPGGARRHRRGAPRAHRGPPRRDRPRRGPRPTRPTPTCACTCSRTGSSQPNTVNLDGIFGVLPNVVWTNHGPCAVDGFEQTRLRLRARGHGRGLRRRQVPADDRLRRAVRACASPTPTASASARTSRRDHRHARGLLQLQRRHARHLDGRGPHRPGRRRRRRLGHRRRRVDHGHAVRRRHGTGQHRRALSARSQRRHRHRTRRRLRRRGRVSTSRPGPR